MIRCGYRKISNFFLVLSVIVLILSGLIWIVFPFAFQALINSNLVLSASVDGRPSQSAFLWANPPTENTLNFYIFNVTNHDEIVYQGAKPSLQQVGPFAVRETEEKRKVTFSENGENVSYESYKHYYFDPSRSCEECRNNPYLYVPNLIALGAVAAMSDPRFNCSTACKRLINAALLLTGERPFRRVHFQEITFDGYDDPLLTFYHSPLMRILEKQFNDGKPFFAIPIPPMQKMGFLYGYNGTSDGVYTVQTGARNIAKIGHIVEWTGNSMLPSTWWSTKQARMINGTDSGSFAPPRLQRDMELSFFQSFLCRSFKMTFVRDSVFGDVPCYRYEVPAEQFDTTLDENIGFRYKNRERINYFSDWNPCPNKRSMSHDNCSSLKIDCSRKVNFCHECCNGTYVDGTYLLPPGMFPLVCYPGKRESTPFSAIVSPPHWIYSPPEVQNSVYGLSPDAELHRPFVYDYEPTTGLVNQLHFRTMVSVPMHRSTDAVIAMHLPNVLVPLLWMDIHVVLKEHIQEMTYSLVVQLPNAMNIVKIVTLVVSLTTITIILYLRSGWNRTLQKHIRNIIYPRRNGLFLSSQRITPETNEQNIHSRM
ncbi:hypothetical protein AB6A40_005469 [Gnathostoma spinigerum]|uniref:Scavenger receptor n=1 Tax=Gnathostoma spinigerum TaxID=75299 RepID=A0ABD6EGN3_9BILA